jgi:hypothetical protein
MASAWACQSAVELWKATWGVLKPCNNEDGGATFSFALPIAKQDECRT